jgi:hypothetical protein
VIKRVVEMEMEMEREGQGGKDRQGVGKRERGKNEDIHRRRPMPHAFIPEISASFCMEIDTLPCLGIPHPLR